MENITIRLDLLNQTSFLGPAVHDYHQDHSRKGNATEDDNEGTVSPTPVRTEPEVLSDPRSGECSCNARGSVDSEDDHTVLQRGDIGSHDVANEQNTDVTRPVENVTGEVCLYVEAGGFHSHTDENDDEHHEETLHATEHIDDLGDNERDATTECSCHDAHDSQETVVAELRNDESAER